MAAVIGWTLAARRCRASSSPRRHRGKQPQRSGVAHLPSGDSRPKITYLRPSSLAPSPRACRPQRRRATAQRLTSGPKTEPKHMACLSTGRRAALARGMGRAHSPQRRASRITRRMRIRNGLAASRLRTARREHRARHPTTTLRHDHMTVCSQPGGNPPSGHPRRLRLVPGRSVGGVKRCARIPRKRSCRLAAWRCRFGWANGTAEGYLLRDASACREGASSGVNARAPQIRRGTSNT